MLTTTPFIALVTISHSVVSELLLDGSIGLITTMAGAYVALHVALAIHRRQQGFNSDIYIAEHIAEWLEKFFNLSATIKRAKMEKIEIEDRMRIQALGDSLDRISAIAIKHKLVKNDQMFSTYKSVFADFHDSIHKMEDTNPELYAHAQSSWANLQNITQKARPTFQN